MLPEGFASVNGAGCHGYAGLARAGGRFCFRVGTFTFRPEFRAAIRRQVTFTCRAPVAVMFARNWFQVH